MNNKRRSEKRAAQRDRVFYGRADAEQAPGEAAHTHPGEAQTLANVMSNAVTTRDIAIAVLNLHNGGNRK